MPKVSDEYRSARRDEIAAAAIRAFGRGGFSGTSIADIIEESGLSAGTIYGHYKSKSDLVRDVAMRIVNARIVDANSFARLDPLPSPGELVGVVMRGLMSDMGRPSLLLQLWGESVTDPELLEVARSIIARLHEAYVRHISAWHQREYGLGEAEATDVAVEQAPLFLAACQGFVVQTALVDGFDADGYLTAVARNLPR